MMMHYLHNLTCLYLMRPKLSVFIYFNGHSDSTSFMYVTFCTFGIACGWIKKILFVPSVILDPKPCASHPK